MAGGHIVCEEGRPRDPGSAHFSTGDLGGAL